MYVDCNCTCMSATIRFVGHVPNLHSTRIQQFQPKTNLLLAYPIQAAAGSRYRQIKNDACRRVQARRRRRRRRVQIFLLVESRWSVISTLYIYIYIYIYNSLDIGLYTCKNSQ